MRGIGKYLPARMGPPLIQTTQSNNPRSKDGNCSGILILGIPPRSCHPLHRHHIRKASSVDRYPGQHSVQSMALRNMNMGGPPLYSLSSFLIFFELEEFRSIKVR